MIIDKLVREQQETGVAQWVRRKTAARDVPGSIFTDARHLYTFLSPPPVPPSIGNVHHQQYALRLNFSVTVEITTDVPPRSIFLKPGRCTFQHTRFCEPSAPTCFDHALTYLNISCILIYYYSILLPHYSRMYTVHNEHKAFNFIICVQHDHNDNDQNLVTGTQYVRYEYSYVDTDIIILCRYSVADDLCGTDIDID